MDAANLPSVVREGELNLPGLTIRVLHLNNGQRVIPAEDWNRVMDWLASTPTDADVAKLAALEDSK